VVDAWCSGGGRELSSTNSFREEALEGLYPIESNYPDGETK